MLDILFIILNIILTGFSFEYISLNEEIYLVATFIVVSVFFIVFTKKSLLEVIYRPYEYFYIKFNYLFQIDSIWKKNQLIENFVKNNWGILEEKDIFFLKDNNVSKTLWLEEKERNFLFLGDSKELFKVVKLGLRVTYDNIFYQMNYLSDNFKIVLFISDLMEQVRSNFVGSLKSKLIYMSLCVGFNPFFIFIKKELIFTILLDGFSKMKPLVPRWKMNKLWLLLC